MNLLDKIKFDSFTKNEIDNLHGQGCARLAKHVIINFFNTNPKPYRLEHKTPRSAFRENMIIYQRLKNFINEKNKGYQLIQHTCDVYEWDLEKTIKGMKKHLDEFLLLSKKYDNNVVRSYLDNKKTCTKK